MLHELSALTFKLPNIDDNLREFIHPKVRRIASNRVHVLYTHRTKFWFVTIRKIDFHQRSEVSLSLLFQVLIKTTSVCLTYRNRIARIFFRILAGWRHSKFPVIPTQNRIVWIRLIFGCSFWGKNGIFWIKIFFLLFQIFSKARFPDH